MASVDEKKAGFFHKISSNRLLNTVVAGIFLLVGYKLKPEDKVPVTEAGTSQEISIQGASSKIETLATGLSQANSQLEALQALLDACTTANERLLDKLRNSGIRPPGASTPFPLVAESTGFGILVQISDARVSGSNYILPFSILNNGPRRNLRMQAERIQITDAKGNIALPTEITFGRYRGTYPTATIANGVSARGELVFTGKGVLTKHIQHLEMRVQVLSGDGFTAEFTDFYVKE